MTRFRMTVWPGRLPEVTVVEDVTPFRLDGDLLRLDLDKATIATFEIPPELYLRGLRDLDLDDPQAIVEFANTYGRLGRFTFTPDRKPSPFDRQITGLLGIRGPDERKLPWEDWWTEVERSPIGTAPIMEKTLAFENGLQHIDSFRAWAHAFRRMADIYESYQRREAKESDVSNMTHVLTELLQPFHPTITVKPDGAEDDKYDPFEDRYPRLENVLALQMYRHIESEDSYHRCANEPCGRLFVHQIGRAEHGQNRGVGVMYCTAVCARNQAARESRKRKKAEQQKSGDT